MTQLADINEAGVEVVALSAWTVAEIMVHLPVLRGNNLVALVADRGVVAMTSVAVGGSEFVGMLHVELAACRPALEAGVAVSADDEWLTHRTTGDAGGMTALTVVDDGVMVFVSCAAAVAEVMAILVMAQAAGRGVVSMTAVAVAGSEVIGVIHVQWAVRAILETDVTAGAFSVRLA